jgi:hypothetical protein
MPKIIEDTMVNKPHDVRMKNLDGIIHQTAAVPFGAPVLDGVIRDTMVGVLAPRQDSGVSKAGAAPKTVARTFGQVPFAGKFF